jgi:hypothetical protein
MDDIAALKGSLLSSLKTVPVKTSGDANEDLSRKDSDVISFSVKPKEDSVEGVDSPSTGGITIDG